MGQNSTFPEELVRNFVTLQYVFCVSSNQHTLCLKSKNDVPLVTWILHNFSPSFLRLKTQSYICTSSAVLLILASFNTWIDLLQCTFGAGNCYLGNIYHEGLTRKGSICKRLMLVQGCTEKVIEREICWEIEKLHQEMEMPSAWREEMVVGILEGRETVCTCSFLASLEFEWKPPSWG